MIQSLQPFAKSSFSPRHISLLMAVLQAHATAAGTNNPISTSAATLLGQAGKPLSDAICAAIGTTGGRHAPLTYTRSFWFNDLQALTLKGWEDRLNALLISGQIIPGFGHSLHKESIAPELNEAQRCIETQFPQAAEFIRAATEIVQSYKPQLFPNMALYTALACELSGIGCGVEPLLMIVPRLPVWAMAWNNGLFA